MTPAELAIALVVLVVVAVIAHAIGTARPEPITAAPAALAVAVLDALDGFDDAHGFLPVPDDVQTARARHIAAQLLERNEGERP